MIDTFCATVEISQVEGEGWLNVCVKLRKADSCLTECAVSGAMIGWVSGTGSSSSSSSFVNEPGRV